MKPLFALLFFLSANLYADDIAPARQNEIIHLLKHDCGACHGITLKGGLGPPLLPDTLTAKPKAFLRYTILEGRPGTAMPPWQDFLTQTEVDWLVERLLHGIDDAPH
ncbi:MAG: cytochrome c [Candidatus Parabeggiatoa sp. nov. 3]|nr:MAG: cytochrome c [Gammaproteobacteria bacterium]RKZ69670.1 MAG: cytochrome c [Gammaproteobacteria bacterium]RKZ88085.1 MAG: cytochrome c [Gammaproteobacteria bacterium]